MQVPVEGEHYYITKEQQYSPENSLVPIHGSITVDVDEIEYYDSQ